MYDSAKLIYYITLTLAGRCALLLQAARTLLCVWRSLRSMAYLLQKTKCRTHLGPTLALDLHSQSRSLSSFIWFWHPRHWCIDHWTRPATSSLVTQPKGHTAILSNTSSATPVIVLLCSSLLQPLPLGNCRLRDTPYKACMQMSWWCSRIRLASRGNGDGSKGGYGAQWFGVRATWLDVSTVTLHLLGCLVLGISAGRVHSQQPCLIFYSVSVSQYWLILPTIRLCYCPPQSNGPFVVLWDSLILYLHLSHSLSRASVFAPQSPLHLRLPVCYSDSWTSLIIGYSTFNISKQHPKGISQSTSLAAINSIWWPKVLLLVAACSHLRRCWFFWEAQYV